MMDKKDKIRELEEAFVTSTIMSFRFLADDYSFLLDKVRASYVKYRKIPLTITISWNSYAYEIDIDFHNEKTGESYNLYEVVMALVPSEEWQLRCRGADITKMKSCLDQLSQLCCQHLQDILTMDKSAHEKVAYIAKEMTRKYTLEAEYGVIKERANIAWEQKDWQKAREYYEKSRPALSKREHRRLKFLNKKSDT